MGHADEADGGCGGLAVGQEVVHNQNMVVFIDKFFGKSQLIIGLFRKGCDNRLVQILVEDF